MRAMLLVVLGAALVLCGCERKAATPPPSAPAAGGITVFAAASTTDVMREMGRLYERMTGTKVAFSFDASSTLARQIRAGAPADVFISADEAWMDDLVSAGMVRPGSRQDLLGNDLVLVAPAGREFEVRMSTDFDFAGALPQVKRIAVGDPAHVPAGRYAHQALEALGWWPGLQGRLLPAQDVSGALRLVEMGESDAGIVYATDVKGSERVTVVGVFPAPTHEPIRYPAALCRDARPGAAEFVTFLHSEEAARVFEGAGFRVLNPGAAPNGGPQ